MAGLRWRVRYHRHAAARSREIYDVGHSTPLPNGTMFGTRWVPTKKGVALSFSNCSKLSSSLYAGRSSCSWGSDVRWPTKHPCTAGHARARC